LLLLATYIEDGARVFLHILLNGY